MKPILPFIGLLIRVLGFYRRNLRETLALSCGTQKCRNPKVSVTFPRQVVSRPACMHTVPIDIPFL